MGLGVGRGGPSGEAVRSRAGQAQALPLNSQRLLGGLPLFPVTCEPVQGIGFPH